MLLSVLQVAVRALFLAVVFLMGMVVLAGAAAAEGGQVGADTNLKQVQVLSLLIGTVLPIVVAFVTKTVTSPSTKAIVLAALAAVSGYGTEYLSGTATFDWWSALLTWLTTFIVTVAMHYGLWKPTGVTAKVQEVGVK